MTRRAAGRADELAPGDFRVVALSAKPGQPIRQAIVVRTPNGDLRAYLNLCRHLPVPLDALTGDPLSMDGGYFECGTHGALFRLEDGYCVLGPCVGKSLFALELVDEGGDLFVVDE